MKKVLILNEKDIGKILAKRYGVSVTFVGTSGTVVSQSQPANKRTDLIKGSITLTLSSAFFVTDSAENFWIFTTVKAIFPLLSASPIEEIFLTKSSFESTVITFNPRASNSAFACEARSMRSTDFFVRTPMQNILLMKPWICLSGYLRMARSDIGGIDGQIPV